MPIAYGLVNICKTTAPSEKTRPHTQVFSLSQDEGEGTADSSMGFQGTIKVSEAQQCSLCSAENEVHYMLLK